jgi:hypothetical protein
MNVPDERGLKHPVEEPGPDLVQHELVEAR